MMRERLTITLKTEILKEVDRIVDGSKIRNRSHAIEYLIQKASGPGIGRALILAGGKGIKPSTLSKEMPKGMLPYHGKPILEHTVDLCKKHGIYDLTISIGPDGQAIEQHFGDGTAFGVHITYIKQVKVDVGTAQSLKQAEKQIGKEPFLLIYGDVVADINLTDMIEFHLGLDTLGTMALTSVAATADWGVVAIHGTRITEFTEKPSGNTHSHVINAGIYCFGPDIFGMISKTDKKLEQDVFPKLAESNMLSGYLFEGRWYDVGNAKIYRDLVKSRPNS